MGAAVNVRQRNRPFLYSESGWWIRPPSRSDWVRELPETVGVFVVSGRDDFLIHLAVPHTDSLCAFVIDRLTERPEAADVRTSVVYEHLRRWLIEPL